MLRVLTIEDGWVGDGLRRGGRGGQRGFVLRVRFGRGSGHRRLHVDVGRCGRLLTRRQTKIERAQGFDSLLREFGLREAGSRRRFVVVGGRVFRVVLLVRCWFVCDGRVSRCRVFSALVLVGCRRRGFSGFCFTRLRFERGSFTGCDLAGFCFASFRFTRRSFARLHFESGSFACSDLASFCFTSRCFTRLHFESGSFTCSDLAGFCFTCGNFTGFRFASFCLTRCSFPGGDFAGFNLTRFCFSRLKLTRRSFLRRGLPRRLF